uniref:Uncharacterized protein n=1 Tax=Alexandrium monilatum TaxID=311494 RepID=A0A7S4SX77_9DINO
MAQGPLALPLAPPAHGASSRRTCGSGSRAGAIRAMIRLILPAVLALAVSKQCEDTFDWTPGKRVPFDAAARQRSITRIGDVRRFRPLLRQLSLHNATVTVLIVGASAVEDPSQAHPWSDVFCEWLRRTFAARVATSRLYLTGVLSQHLQVIPASAALVRPDLIFVEISLTPLVEPSKYSIIDQTPQYLVVETFMRAMLVLPGHPALVWVDLMSGAEQLHTNEEVDSLLTEYYDVPQVSVRGAWHHQLPFPSSELWHGRHLSLLGHKLVAVTLANFMCFEFSETCKTTKDAGYVLPKAVFSQTPKAPRAANASSPPSGRLDFAFCDSQGSVLPAAAGTPHEQLSWSLAVTLAVLPLGLLLLCTSFVGSGGDYLQNVLPQSMPELEFLRVIATVNIVAWQYYQELPPPWSQPDSGVWQVCHDPYYGYPDWDRTKRKVCPDVLACTWCRSGKYCFQFFFLLQAFVSTLNAVRTGAASPAWQYAQVWPLHALSLLLAIASSAPVNPLDLALVASLAHAWITPFHSELNGASWYLSVLVGFWIVLPVWVRAADRLAATRGISGVLGALLTTWLCTLLLPLLLYVWPVDFGLREVDPRMVVHNFVAYSPYTNWQPVAIGLLLAVLVMLGIEPRTPAAVTGCLALACAGLALVWFAAPSPGFAMGGEYLLMEKGFALQPLFALLMLGSLGLRHLPGAVRGALAGPSVLRLARLCWPVFILHQPVHRLCLRRLFPLLGSGGSPPAARMALYPLVLVLLSAAASHVVDRPWTSLLYRYRSAAGARVASASAGGGGSPLVYDKVGAQGSDPETPFRGPGGYRQGSRR